MRVRYGWGMGILLAVAGCAADHAAEDKHGHEAPATEKAICILEAVGDNKVAGTILFTKEKDAVVISGEVTGLTPGEHGFHVHQFGDLSDKKEGMSVGGHFDPHGKPHGKPEDHERHVGDLGNITADDNGVAKVDIRDSVVSFSGENNVLGRSIVVHANRDDFGQPVGNAGPRVAIGVIGIAKP